MNFSLLFNSFRPFVVKKTPLDKEGMWLLLDVFGVDYQRYDHQAVFTVEESREITGHFPGGHTKNLFLRDRKKNYWLLTALESTKIDLKIVSKRLGAKGSLSFVEEAMLYEKLGVRAGSVTPLSMINNRERDVRVVLDRDLFLEEMVNVHPLRNDATVGLHCMDLLDLLRFWGHRVTVMFF